MYHKNNYYYYSIHIQNFLCELLSSDMNKQKILRQAAVYSAVI